MIEIDGSQGEGGGQMVRNSCALAIATGLPFRITQIRARRSRPGLMRQHVTAVEAACVISGAECSGLGVGSSELTFRPGKVMPGEYHFAVGTAGSTGLVLQTVLMPLAMADKPSRLVLEGGTHNMLAPPFDFIERCFLPVINRMGPRCNPSTASIAASELPLSRKPCLQPCRSRSRSACSTAPAKACPIGRKMRLLRGNCPKIRGQA
jgi:RNA 3'-terminal phosphate cyclase (ATP)